MPRALHDNLGFAAALLSLGEILLPELVVMEGGAYKMFAFEMDENDMDILFLKYKRGQIAVDAQKNADSIRKLKKMLFDFERIALAAA